MQGKINLAVLAVATSLMLGLAGGCAPKEHPLHQQPATSHMKKAVGTPDELSPLAPGGARNVRKVGKHWLCDLDGKVMVYHEAAGRWEPQRR